MKTIKQLSKELKVTPQAIYKKVNNQLHDELMNHLTKGEKGETLVDAEGIEIIKQSFTKQVDETVNSKVDMNLIEMLKTELDYKNKLIESQSRQIENYQKILAVEQQQRLLLMETREVKQLGFFEKLFKKGGSDAS